MWLRLRHHNVEASQLKRQALLRPDVAFPNRPPKYPLLDARLLFSPTGPHLYPTLNHGGPCDQDTVAEHLHQVEAEARKQSKPLEMEGR
jgi:hypothetical protein